MSKWSQDFPSGRSAQHSQSHPQRGFRFQCFTHPAQPRRLVVESSQEFKTRALEGPSDSVRISFSATLSRVPPALVRDVCDAMLVEIAGHVNPERQGRLEPRSACRERRHYPSLRMTRVQWRARHAVNGLPFVPGTVSDHRFRLQCWLRIH